LLPNLFSEGVVESGINRLRRTAQPHALNITPSGVYSYSLIVDEKVAATKIMVKDK
jgi:hypothetical protein